MDFDKSLDKLLNEAIADANVGEKALAYGKLKAAKEYAIKAKILFPEEEYRKKINFAYQNTGIEKKISIYREQAYICASEGRVMYRDYLSDAIKQTEEFEDDLKRKSMGHDVRWGSKTIIGIYRTVGLARVKEKKSKEIMEYASNGDDESMFKAIKDNDNQFHFTDDELEEFYSIYNFQGRLHKIDSLLLRAEEHAKKLDKDSMNHAIGKAKELSKDFIVYEPIITWIRAMNIKIVYHKNKRRMLSAK
ncbi:MAG: hypothetical protein NT066_07140 [Candidatus Omnitrophica bacterium]|nr:hypothetical protein [Candidatus Omnitrophota bacterium]